MKTNTLALLFTVLAALFIVVPAASAQSSVTRVRGNVYGPTGGVSGLPVTVNCNGNVANAATNSSGLYVVEYSATLCPAFTGVSASVTYQGQPQSQTVFVSGSNTATLDFYYGAAVPELGAVTGVVAAIGSAVTYMGIRKKLS